MELEEAIQMFLKQVQAGCKMPTFESAKAVDSLGRVTSEAVYANISSPHFNACAMDGIALKASSTFGATETTPVLLNEGRDYVRVDTGDPLPDEYDSVVMIEEVIERGNGIVQLIGSVAPWQHIRQIGEDICAGEMILPSNTEITPAAIGAMLAGGVLSVNVWKRPIVGLIPTGDEIVAPTDKPKKGDILEFNSSVFSALLSGWKAASKIYGIVADNLSMIKSIIKNAASECDIVIVNAGSSAGREDYTEKAIKEIGEVFVHGISIRPGKPTILGMVDGKPVIGVPGYPVSGIIVMEELVKPLIRQYTRLDTDKPDMAEAVLSRRIVSSLKYKEFVRVKLGDVDGRLVATPLSQGAGVITSFVKADGLFEIPMNSEGFDGGSKIKVSLLKDLNQIRNTLVLTGSHDPLLDVVTDIMRRKYSNEYIASSHVGSMGGIMAVKRSEAHGAAIHLLDEATGEYNTSYIKKYLGDQRIALIQCAGRQQGLMVAKGNPKKITSVEDISLRDNRYVNRQKGSGTRILLDYLIRKDAIESENIYGYGREEFTHLSVAALVAAGSADTGLGIKSAADIYSLDFIPICEEQYDIIIPERYLGLEFVKHFIEILQSRDFKDALMKLGGYILDKPGDIQIIE
jgi:Molybdopterin biosynthesis enzyme